MRWILSFAALLMLCAPLLSDGFTISTTAPNVLPKSQSRAKAIAWNGVVTSLGMSVDDESETDGEKSTSNDSEKRKASPALRAAVGAVESVINFGFLFIGAYFGFGLLLNLSGYAYRFDMQHGYEIDTIPQMRTKLQFEAEARKMEKAASEVRPNTYLPR
mmetsp:Transcript_22804/g.46291  ORF Transcript_22804/g.46291 Transcript_22804/m.46291 type:complete len:160 (-) Transcript_22804:326-805(-)|eukprot:CAMPEP_0183309932 /NCGR_PEP_ID=MMETSP0160_2-20130417/27348_1 /TAXON_ID=2839 ORGANISM="Odontella Sinensis, Strain Grunow 1884" /NCGR_SAMPLE_ID=MMETSP0160_2 /ASSEMBLY_ACC=CAM_ASM_000250 /LENGTH=159 /DNA_ID=CAMNT_0025474041 /DNA_START=71 /DNA_END=550 /DNA_ORIENTATION=+